VSGSCDLATHDAYQLVSQGCSARIGNLVNPAYTVSVSLPKALLPGQPVIMDGTHDRLRGRSEVAA
jgi:acetamidase/formamidase